MKFVKPLIFWPALIILIGAAVLSLSNPELFLTVCTNATKWILDSFGQLFSLATLLFLVIVLAIYVSPLGKTKLGGPEAKPMLSKWRWFAITLCTTIAVGILFWSTAEPLYHFHDPPDFIKASTSSVLSILYTHWSLSPYAIYTLAGLSFAIVFYQFKQPLSLTSLLYPLTGRMLKGWQSDVFNSLCLFSLIAGMAASLGAGILIISGGLAEFFGWNTHFLRILVVLLIGALFVLSSISGLLKGIRFFSNVNLLFLIGFLIIFIWLGPTKVQWQEGLLGLKEYFQFFIPRSLEPIYAIDDWDKSWTTFYWANWMAWAPITALFLGKIAKGYTIREFIRINMFYPSLFSIIWMAVFGTTAIWTDMNEEALLHELLLDKGPETIIYALLDQFNVGPWLSILFIVLAVLSYVTAADSNTQAIADLCTKQNSARWQYQMVKIIWGGLICFLAFIMISYAGIDGIKMASNLGGLPALVLLILAAIGLIRLLLQGKNSINLKL